MPKETLGAGKRVPRGPKGRSGVRTANRSEAQVLEDLDREGYLVTKRGMPRLLATRPDGGAVFVYIGPLSPEQKRVRDILVAGGARVRVMDP